MAETCLKALNNINEINPSQKDEIKYEISSGTNLKY